jgi:hypothetical protein
MSTPEERYQVVLGGKTFTCPDCEAQQVLPAHLDAQHDDTLGTIHVIACPQCQLEYAICFDRLDTVGMRTPGRHWETRSFTWLLQAQSPGW